MALHCLLHRCRLRGRIHRLCRRERSGARLLARNDPRINGGVSVKGTLAEAIREEERAFRCRFVAHTRPREPMTLEEAMAEGERMARAMRDED